MMEHPPADHEVKRGALKRQDRAVARDYGEIELTCCFHHLPGNIDADHEPILLREVSKEDASSTPKLQSSIGLYLVHSEKRSIPFLLEHLGKSIPVADRVIGRQAFVELYFPLEVAVSPRDHLLRTMRSARIPMAAIKNVPTKRMIEVSAILDS